MADVDHSQRIERQWLHLRMAGHAILMRDNERLLATTAAEDRALRHQRHRFREHRLAAQGVPGSSPMDAPGEQDMGDINIDSPTSIHYHYPAPPPPATTPPVPALPAPPRKPTPWLPIALLAGAAALGPLLGILAWRATQPATPGTNTTIEKKSGLLLELEQAK